jgi:carboxylesterase type B
MLCLILQGVDAAAPRQSRPPRAHVDGGVVEGSYYDARSTDAVFKGIPLAAPPVGELR